MVRLARVRSLLGRFGIRGTSDFAEVLVAEALGGERVPSGVNQGFDLIVASQ
jgi:hypothetical protein